MHKRVKRRRNSKELVDQKHIPNSREIGLKCIVSTEKKIQRSWWTQNRDNPKKLPNEWVDLKNPQFQR